jgi:hypothetical protein
VASVMEDSVAFHLPSKKGWGEDNLRLWGWQVDETGLGSFPVDFDVNGFELSVLLPHSCWFICSASYL